MPCFRVMRNSQPIAEHSLKPEIKGKEHGITYEPLFGYAEAVVAAGLDLEKLYAGVYSNSFLGFVLAWYANHKLVQIHIEDANFRKPKRR